MKCSKCETSSFVEIIRPQSNKEIYKEKRISILVCSKCDPVLASMSLLTDGFSIASKCLFVECLTFQTEEEAQKVRDSHKAEFLALTKKYNKTPQELIRAAQDDEIENTDDLFLVFTRSYSYNEGEC
jgi:hypothetical protein